MDEALIATLLRRSESETLDFKRDQYTFHAPATDEQKAELLKDILAFANAWKTDDAYILVGVAEENQLAGEVVGVTPLLNDHEIQQFVNGKTNKPLNFNVLNVFWEGKTINVIRIHRKQARPLYLKKPFGRLSANIVFVRRGSSTGTADIDEIADMGRRDGIEQTVSLPVHPEVDFSFEIRLETWTQLFHPKTEHDVALLRVTMVNVGTAAANVVEGSVTLPSLTQHRENILDSFKPVTCSFTNRGVTPDPFGIMGPSTRTDTDFTRALSARCRSPPALARS